MLRKLQLLIMIFCLGIFIFPNQNFATVVSENSCCEAQTQSSDCCKKEEKKSNSCDHDSKKDKNCKDNCSSCKICNAGFVFSVILNSLDTLNAPIFEISNPFSYDPRTPLEGSFNIWQPPKLG